MAEEKKQKKKKKKHRLLWAFIWLQILLIMAVVGVVSFYYIGGYASQVSKMHAEAVSFVRNSDEDTFRRSLTSEAYDTDGKVISVMRGEVDSYYLSFDEIPLDATEAIVSIEDKKFYHHPGYDLKAIVRAAYAMVRNRKITQGGSTITQQLARTIFLTNDRTWQRKVEEIYIAVELEKKYSKQQILEFYLNNIYFGNGYYGIQAAAQGYFRKDVAELSTSQVAFLCGLPNNPTLYNPRKELQAAVSRRDRVLRNMYEDGILSSENYQKAVFEEISIKKARTVHNNYMETYLYYCATRALMEADGFEFRTSFADSEDEAAYKAEYDQLYDEYNATLFSGGYRIYTTLDQTMQKQLQDSIDNGLSSFKEKSDEGIYKLQGSGVCIDNDTGCVRAIVGGRGQKLEGYTLNRAFQSFRQPGSAIKPLIVYTPALENGMTPSTTVKDEPIEDGPKNSDGIYEGKITLRKAVEKSKNTVAWKIFEKLTPSVGLSYLEEMDFRGLENSDYRTAAALGGFTRGVSALEMAKGYATILNDGAYREPTCIAKITNPLGDVIYENASTERIIYQAAAARDMTDILQGTFTNGTARGLELDDGMPCAGKTGTTNDNKDGWFVGYTRYYTTAIWVGYDMPKKLTGLAGSTYPGRIWQNFMNKIHKGKKKLKFLKPIRVTPQEKPEFDDTDVTRELEERRQQDQVQVDLTPSDNDDDTGGNSGGNNNGNTVGNSGGNNGGNSGGNTVGNSGGNNGGNSGGRHSQDEDDEDDLPELPPEDIEDDPGDDE